MKLATQVALSVLMLLMNCVSPHVAPVEAAPRFEMPLLIGENLRKSRKLLKEELNQDSVVIIKYHLTNHSTDIYVERNWIVCVQHPKPKERIYPGQRFEVGIAWYLAVAFYGCP
ncbi:hypothetical protein MHN82_04270 [Mycolicibacterium sp. OfavD-34-C]|nr:hypothetical protein [Mycolicibacterium sp. OfavD-34-C]